MEKIFYETKKIFAIMLIILMTIIAIEPISKAAYIDSMKEGEKYEYRGNLLFVYKSKESAKNSSIFGIEKILRKGSKITIKEIDENIIKIGDKQYIKCTLINSLRLKKVEESKNDAVEETKPEEPQEEEKQQQPEVVKVKGITLEEKEINLYYEKGWKYTLKATVSPSNATNKKVTWKSSNTKIATVDANGTVTGKSVGEATITATTEDGKKTATCKIIVTKLVINKTSLSLEKGKTEVLNVKSAQNKKNVSVTWKSNNTKVATVDKNGKVTAVSKGTTKIVATDKNGNKLDCEVTVKEVSVTGVKLNKTDIKLEPKKTYTLKATVSPSNATNKSVKWESSNTKIATVDKYGKVTAKSAGIAKITVKTADGGKKAVCKVNVKTPVTGIKINKTSIELNIGEKGKLETTITPSNATNKSIKCSSSNEKIATVKNKNGVITVTAKAEGTATITVKTNDGGKIANCKITVKDPYKYTFRGNTYKIAVTSDKLNFVLSQIKKRGIYQNNGWTDGFTKGKCYRIAICHLDMLLDDNVAKNIKHGSGYKQSYSSYYQKVAGNKPDQYTSHEWYYEDTVKRFIDSGQPISIYTRSQTGSEHWAVAVGYKGKGSTMNDLLFISCTNGVLCLNGEIDVNGSNGHFITLNK